MAVNKVVYGNTTLIDLTDSNLTSDDQILSGTTAYDRSGVLRSGTAQVGTKVYDGDDTSDPLYPELFMDTVASGVGALIVGGITISEPPLYENSATTTSIGATTVPINANDYELFILVARRGTSLSAYVQTVFKKDEWSLISIADQYNIFRSLRVTDATFEFTVCNKQSSYGQGNWTTDNSYIIPYRLYGIKSATAISTSLQHIFPNYNVSQTLNSGSSSGTTTFTGTITEAGYLQARINVTATAGNNFVRVKINGSTIWEKQDKVSQNYVYTWSPMFYVKAGDTYSVELDSGSGSCNKYVYFYGLR